MNQQKEGTLNKRTGEFILDVEAEKRYSEQVKTSNLQAKPQKSNTIASNFNGTLQEQINYQMTISEIYQDWLPQAFDPENQLYFIIYKFKDILTAFQERNNGLLQQVLQVLNEEKYFQLKIKSIEILKDLVSPDRVFKKMVDMKEQNFKKQKQDLVNCWDKICQEYVLQIKQLNTIIRNLKETNSKLLSKLKKCRQDTLKQEKQITRIQSKEARRNEVQEVQALQQLRIRMEEKVIQYKDKFDDMRRQNQVYQQRNRQLRKQKIQRESRINTLKKENHQLKKTLEILQGQLYKHKQNSIFFAEKRKKQQVHIHLSKNKKNRHNFSQQILNLAKEVQKENNLNNLIENLSFREDQDFVLNEVDYLRELKQNCLTALLKQFKKNEKNPFLTIKKEKQMFEQTLLEKEQLTYFENSINEILNQIREIQKRIKLKIVECSLNRVQK